MNNKHVVLSGMLLCSLCVLLIALLAQQYNTSTTSSFPAVASCIIRQVRRLLFLASIADFNQKLVDSTLTALTAYTYAEY